MILVQNFHRRYHRSWRLFFIISKMISKTCGTSNLTKTIKYKYVLRVAELEDCSTKQKIQYKLYLDQLDLDHVPRFIKLNSNKMIEMFSRWYFLSILNMPKTKT
jgi:hypothetical protein